MSSVSIPLASSMLDYPFRRQRDKQDWLLGSLPHGIDMKLERSNKKAVISYKELGILKDPAVLEDPSTSTIKDMVNLLCYPSGIAIQSLALQCWSLLPRTWNFQPSVSCKIQKERVVVVNGTRAKGANAYLISSCLGANDSIKVVQDNECISMGTSSSQ